MHLKELLTVQDTNNPDISIPGWHKRLVVYLPQLEGKDFLNTGIIVMTANLLGAN